MITVFWRLGMSLLTLPTAGLLSVPITCDAFKCDTITLHRVYNETLATISFGEPVTIKTGSYVDWCGAEGEVVRYGN